MLENLGLRVVAEEPFGIDSVAWRRRSGSTNSSSPATPLRPTSISAAVKAASRRRWSRSGPAASRTTASTGSSSRPGSRLRQVTVLRLYAKLLRQAGTAFSQAYMEDTLAPIPTSPRRLVRLFEIALRSDRRRPLAGGDAAQVQAIDHALDAVASLDEDRILRSFLMLVLKSLRTNYFQRGPPASRNPISRSSWPAARSICCRCRGRSTRSSSTARAIEGVHLRGGKVARGGIRWSDRKEDFRTEILGLMKAQMVKNAVIVPVGSKGGFVVKQPPARQREQLRAEASNATRS